MKKKIPKVVRVIKLVNLILSIVVLIGFATGIFMLNFTDEEALGTKFVGFSVLVTIFLLMPLFLYVRLRGKKLKDYTLTPENIEKWRNKLDE